MEFRPSDRRRRGERLTNQEKKKKTTVNKLESFQSILGQKRSRWHRNCKSGAECVLQKASFRQIS